MRFWMLGGVLSLCAALLGFPALAAGETGEAALTRLIEARLALQPDVARYKWNAQAAIDDPAREQQIIERLRAQATARGVPAPWAERFFRAQIEAGKTVQRELFAQWQAAKQGRFEDAPDLVKQTRPQLDALTAPLLQALAEVWPRLTRGEIPATTWQLPQAERLSPRAADRALAPLREGRTTAGAGQSSAL